MTGRLLGLSERWFRLLLRLYPVDFRDDLGQAVAETYRNRARDAYARRGLIGVAGVWVQAFVDALRNVLGDGARLITLGVLIGRYVVGQLIRGALIGVSPLDLSTIAAVSSGLAAIALLACYLPARCVRLDPADSLRQE